MDMLQEVKTYKNLQKLLAQLGNVQLEISGKRTKYESIIKRRFNKLAPSIYKYLEKEGVTTKDSVVKKLAKLTTTLKEAEIVEVVIAVDATEEVVDKMYRWARENIGKNIVLDIKSNPLLLGGATVTFKGKYGDYSVSKKLDKIIGDLKKEES